MKNKHQYNADIKKWDKLVRKFQNLYTHITASTDNNQHLVRMKRKLHLIYLRLEKMQYKMGVKLASTTLALMLVSALGYSQSFNSAGFLKGYPATVDVGDSSVPAFADIDGDNDLDLYIGCSIGNICILENDGNNNFNYTGNLKADGSEIELEGHSSPAFFDLDKDGDLDILVGNDDGKVKAYENNDGQFSFLGNLKADGFDIFFPGEEGGDRIHIELADLDNDSDLDLYIGNYSGQITIFNNNGNNIFSKQGFLQADNVNIKVESLAAPTFVDLDNDDDLDLYLGEGHGTIHVFTNDGNGNFSEIEKLQADGKEIADFGSFVDPVFEDLDNDGDSDLFLGNGTGNIVVFKNDGNSTFARSGHIQANGVSVSIGYLSMPEFADIDNDGDLDLYLGGIGGYIEFFNNIGNNVFSSEGYLQANNQNIQVNYLAAPAFADIDNDGDLDLFIGEKYGHIKVYSNDGSGNFSDEGFLQVNNEELNVGYNTYPTFADIDKDGDLDLYVGTDYCIKIFNNNDGSFTDAGKLQANGTDIYAEYLLIPKFADLDKDGDLDLYTGDAYGYLTVFKNDGNGNFSLPKLVQADNEDLTTYMFCTPAFADFDEDGDLDLYSGNLIGTVEVFLNDGTIDINKSNLESNVSIYPNPTKGLINITADNNSHITVYDVSGKLIQDFYNKYKFNNELIIDLKNYKSGIYFLKIWNSEKTLIEKIIIE